MEDVVREPIELIDDDLDEVAGGLGAAAAAASLVVTGAAATVGGISIANGAEGFLGLFNAAAGGF